MDLIEVVKVIDHSTHGFDGWAYCRRALMLDVHELTAMEFQEADCEGNA